MLCRRNRTTHQMLILLTLRRQAMPLRLGPRNCPLVPMYFADGLCCWLPSVAQLVGDLEGPHM